MCSRVMYPLTPEAKQASIDLVQAWNKGELDRFFILYEQHSDYGVANTFVASYYENKTDFSPPKRDIFLELAEYGLVSIIQSEEDFHVLLLQELKNAVENDFAVSDFFLVTQTIGTVIVAGDNFQLTGTVMSAATQSGEIIQSYETLAQNLSETLGKEYLESNHAIREAILGLSSGSTDDRRSKLGHVILELGRNLQHGANTATIGAALFQLARFIS